MNSFEVEDEITERVPLKAAKDIHFVLK